MITRNKFDNILGKLSAILLKVSKLINKMTENNSGFLNIYKLPKDLLNYITKYINNVEQKDSLLFGCAMYRRQINYAIESSHIRCINKMLLKYISDGNIVIAVQIINAFKNEIQLEQFMICTLQSGNLKYFVTLFKSFDFCELHKLFVKNIIYINFGKINLVKSSINILRLMRGKIHEHMMFADIIRRIMTVHKMDSNQNEFVIEIYKWLKQNSTDKMIDKFRDICNFDIIIRSYNNMIRIIDSGDTELVKSMYQTLYINDQYNAYIIHSLIKYSIHSGQYNMAKEIINIKFGSVSNLISITKSGGFDSKYKKILYKLQNKLI